MFTIKHENNNQSVKPNLQQCYQLLLTNDNIVPFLNIKSSVSPSTLQNITKYKSDPLSQFHPKFKHQLNTSSIKANLVLQKASKPSQVFTELILTL